MTRACWIFGKGPSLGLFNQCGLPRFAVNEAAFVVSDCSAVCKDLLMIKKYQGRLSTKIPIYHKYGHRLRRLDNYIQYPMLKVLPHHSYHNSIALTVTICKQLGYMKQYLVGCEAIDGDTSYSDVVLPYISAPPKNLIIGAKLLEEHIKQEGVEVIWVHRHICLGQVQVSTL